MLQNAAGLPCTNAQGWTVLATSHRGHRPPHKPPRHQPTEAGWKAARQQVHSSRHAKHKEEVACVSNRETHEAVSSAVL